MFMRCLSLPISWLWLLMSLGRLLLWVTATSLSNELEKSGATCRHMFRLRGLHVLNRHLRMFWFVYTQFLGLRCDCWLSEDMAGLCRLASVSVDVTARVGGDDCRQLGGVRLGECPFEIGHQLRGSNWQMLCLLTCFAEQIWIVSLVLELLWRLMGTQCHDVGRIRAERWPQVASILVLLELWLEWELLLFQLDQLLWNETSRKVLHDLNRILNVLVLIWIMDGW